MFGRVVCHLVFSTRAGSGSKPSFTCNEGAISCAILFVGEVVLVRLNFHDKTFRQLTLTYTFSP